MKETRKKAHQRKIMLNKTEWISMEFVWVPDEAGEQVLEIMELLGRN